jgi:hypothetical protein
MPQAPADAAPTGMLKTLQLLLRDLPGLLGGRVEILALELHRAGLALVQMAMLVVVVAILGVTAWVVLWVGIVAALMAMGLHLALALGVALLLNLLAAWLALRRVVALLAVLKMPTTRRHFTAFPAARAAWAAAQPGARNAAAHSASFTDPRAHEHPHRANTAQPAAPGA